MFPFFSALEAKRLLLGRKTTEQRKIMVYCSHEEDPLSENLVMEKPLLCTDGHRRRAFVLYCLQSL